MMISGLFHVYPESVLLIWTVGQFFMGLSVHKLPAILPCVGINI